MRFKYWLHLQEAIDQNTEKALSYQKQRVDPKEFDDFIDQLKNDPDPIDRGSAFDKLKEKFPILITDKKKEKFSIEAPIDPFFKEYYKQLTSVPKQITKPEYDTLLFFSKENRDLLSEMMESLRSLIYQKKIELNFINNIPTIVYRNEAIPIEDFTQFTRKLHEIEGQDATKPSNKNLADPFFLEVFHKEKLVAKNPDKTIWVFKATGPLDCRLMGKGQSWCISSSSSGQWYFNYRHDHGQTQYFIFDFNKDEKDPARYVNPGVAPEGEYSEWVDTRNSHDDINGYSSVQEYKNYLKSKGIDIGVFVADPLTEEEELLKKSSEEYNFSSRGKDEIFQEFKEGQYKELFDKFIETMSFLDIGLMEDHFNQLSDQQKKLYLSNVGDDGLQYLIRRSKNSKEMINQIITLVKDKLNAVIVKALLESTSNTNIDAMMNQIFPLIKDKLDSDMVSVLFDTSGWRVSLRDEMEKQIFSLVKDKLDGRMVAILLYNSKNKDAMMNQIFPLIKDKLDWDIVRVLLVHSSNKDEMINKILPFVKDKLDSKMVNSLLEESSKKNCDELINQIFPFVKDKLDLKMVSSLLHYSNWRNKDAMMNQIFPFVKDKLDSDMVDVLLRSSSSADEMIDQILPYVKDKLDSAMVKSLLQFLLDANLSSSYINLQIDKILPFVKDKLDSAMVDVLLGVSSNKYEMKKKIDSMKLRYQMKKRIDDMKSRAKEQNAI